MGEDKKASAPMAETPKLAERMPLEIWAKRNPHRMVSAEMVRIEMKWPTGWEVTEADYLAAVERILTTPVGFKGAGMDRRLTPAIVTKGRL